MARVRVVTDTISCLPPKLIKEYDITVVPIPLSINGKPYRDQVDITPAEFWKMFQTGQVKAFSTGAPAIGEFADIFRGVAKSTDRIFCTFVSKALSAINEAGIQASQMVRSENPGLEIEILDSKTATGAEGFIVLEAAKAAKAGKSLSEVVKVAQDMLPRVKFVTGMETLRYLIKSGRAPKMAYMGELLQVKPIIGMVSGTGLVENLGRARGNGKCMAKLADMMKDYVDISKPLHVSVHYTDRIEDGEKLRDLVTSQYKCSEVYLTPYTPVMSGHTGPLVAVSFYS